MKKVADFFEFGKLGTNFRTETLAGLTTFLSMAYILFVNPSILADAGMDRDAVFVATAITTSLATLIMGIYARYPIGVAPAMGVNAFFAYVMIIGMEIPWQTALAAVFVAGVLFLILAVSGLRETIINAIPRDLKLAIASGIGLFIAFIGFRTSGLVVASGGPTLIEFGNLHDPGVLLAVFGIFAIIALMVLGVRGAIFFGMMLAIIVGIIFKILPTPTAIVAPIPSMAPTFGAVFVGFEHMFTAKMIMLVLTLLFIDFFDTAGTLIAVTEQAGLVKNGKLPRLNRALLADASSSVFGAVFGTATPGSYIESSAGVAVGGRSGFTAVVVGLLFLAGLFFSPLLSVVTSSVTGPALIVVGILMASSLKDIDWKSIEMAAPAFFTVALMPMTGSIVTGLTVGVLFYPLTMTLKGRRKEVHPIMWGLAVLFVFYHAFSLH